MTAIIEVIKFRDDVITTSVGPDVPPAYCENFGEYHFLIHEGYPSELYPGKNEYPADRFIYVSPGQIQNLSSVYMVGDYVVGASYWYNPTTRRYYLCDPQNHGL